MTNLVLAIIIIVAGFLGSSAKAGNGLRLLMLVVIGAVLLFVSGTAASAGDFGPALGVGAFLGSLGAIFLYRRMRR
jgi:hypothetical protein